MKWKALLLGLASNPLFWIAAIVGSLILFIMLFEHVPNFGVNQHYRIFE